MELSPVLNEKFRLTKIGYFGSFARGEQKEDSDIDLLVESTEPLNCWDLSEKLAAMFGRKVDVVVSGLVLEELRESIMEDVRFIDGKSIVGPAFPQSGDRRYMKQKRIDIYLKDILGAMKKIESKTTGLDVKSFAADEDICMIVERCFELDFCKVT